MHQRCWSIIHEQAETVDFYCPAQKMGLLFIVMWFPLKTGILFCPEKGCFVVKVLTVALDKSAVSVSGVSYNVP